MKHILPLMRIALFLLLLFAFASLLPSCNSPKPQQREFRVIVSILPQKYLVDRLSGGNIPCEVMIPPGGNHETFEPSPRDMERVSNASIYFTIGALDFEKAWVERVKAVNADLQIVNTSSGISLIEGHSHDQNDNFSVDPHTWLSPDAVKIQVQAIYQALCIARPSDSTVFRINLEKFLHEADSADNYITNLVAPFRGKYFLIYHPALAYFAREYGFNQVSIEYEGKDPTPLHMQEIIDLAKEKGIKAIFVSKEFDTRHAETIAKQLNARLITFDPMAYNWTENIMRLADLIAGSMNNQLTP